MTSSADTQDTDTADSDQRGNAGIDNHGGHDRSHDVIVGVRFELSPRPPYAHAYPPATLIATVLNDAMRHFKVQPDPNTAYYLTAHRARVDETATLGHVAGRHDDVEFRLAKELIQGGV